MAAVTGAPWVATIVLVDGEGHSSNVQLNFDGGASQGQIQTFMEAFVPLLSAITTCDVRTVSVTLLINKFDGGTGQGDVEKGAKFVFEAEDTAKVMQTRIPGIEPALIPDTTNKVNLAAPSVAAFTDAFITGLGGVLPRDSETRQIVGVVSAGENFTRARRG